MHKDLTYIQSKVVQMKRDNFQRARMEYHAAILMTYVQHQETDGTPHHDMINILNRAGIPADDVLETLLLRVRLGETDTADPMLAFFRIAYDQAAEAYGRPTLADMDAMMAAAEALGGA